MPLTLVSESTLQKERNCFVDEWLPVVIQACT